ncbi:hypothetical protein AAVH_21144 [Aphelenchoides avenae]|nr:hypothetical protein AAVH_21144 [Aphelenchus avenae]
MCKDYIRKNYVTKTKQKAQAAWLGLVDKKHNVNHTAKCTCWKWLDGTPFSYENFAPGQPKNLRKTEWCTEVFPARSTSRWERGTTCAAKHTQAIGALLNGTQALVNGGFTQSEAQKRCRELGGNLATITSAASTQCLIDYATKTSQKAPTAWLGLVDRQHNVKHTANCTCWKWLDGTPFNYENFAPGQPINLRKTEWCTEILLPRSNLPVGTWNDLRCEVHKRAALCSMPSKPQARPTPGGTRKPVTPRARRTPPGTAKPPTRRASAKPARTPKPATRRVGPKKGRPTPRTPNPAKTTKRHIKPKPAKETCQKSAAAVPLYRAYNGDVQDHFYTTKFDELASAKTKHGYKGEGITGRILRTKAPKSTELYRLYHKGSNDHFYATNKEERDNAISKLGYKDQGTVGYVYKASNGKCPCPEVRPLYRVHNSGAVDHFYTMNKGEKDQAISKLGYKDEGIAACIFPGN